MSDVKRVEKGLYTCGPIIIESEARMGLPHPEWQVRVNHGGRETLIQALPNLRSAKHVARRMESTLMGFANRR